MAKDISIKDVKKALGFTDKEGCNSTASFMKEWKALDTDAKEQLKAGIADGSMTY